MRTRRNRHRADSTHLTMGKLTNKLNTQVKNKQLQEKENSLVKKRETVQGTCNLHKALSTWHYPCECSATGHSIFGGLIRLSFPNLSSFLQNSSCCRIPKESILQSCTNSLFQLILDQGILSQFKVKNYQDKFVQVHICRRIHSENVAFYIITYVQGLLTEFSQVLQYVTAGCCRNGIEASVYPSSSLQDDL